MSTASDYSKNRTHLGRLAYLVKRPCNTMHLVHLAEGVITAVELDLSQVAANVLIKIEKYQLKHDPGVITAFMDALIQAEDVLRRAFMIAEAGTLDEEKPANASIEGFITTIS